MKQKEIAVSFAENKSHKKNSGKTQYFSLSNF